MESQSAVRLTDQHLSICNQQHAIAPIQSATVNQHHVASTTLTSPHADSLTVQSTGSNLLVQQCRDFFQYYYLSCLDKTTDDSQYTKIWDLAGQSINHVTYLLAILIW